MKIIHITAECYPIAKVGGLADVAGSLPKYQNDIGAESCVVMPFYNKPFTQKAKVRPVWSGSLELDQYYNFKIVLK